MSSLDIAERASGSRRGRWGLHTAARERTGEERWARPALVVLLVATAGAYIWNLGASGYANSFYAAAVQAGTESWKAFFFGALDSSSFITVDKPPASLWVMALSGRVFGFGSWSMLVPQALEGVAAVALLHATVKRWFGAGPGLLAGAIFAMTPVAALMFRFNNPDALLVMLLVASAYCLTRAIERADTRWLLATGALVGFAFLAKMGQAMLVVPGFAVAYALAAPTPLRRRATQLLGGLVAMLVAGGWWVAVLALLPASSRPFIDGSPDNNIFNLIFGYNGFSRIFGSSGPAGLGGGGGGGGVAFSGPAGLLRLFDPLMGGQASWLLPAALVGLFAGLWTCRGAARTDRSRAALIVWGGWLLVTAAIFSFSTGVIHTYYLVALAPAIAALVAIGAARLWQRRDALWARAAAAATIAGTAAWAYALLERTPSWEPWLRTLIVLSATLVVVAILALPAASEPLRRRAVLAAAVFAAIACFAGPFAYAVQTVSTAHAGSIPSAGPATNAARAGGGFAGAGGSSIAGGFRGGRGAFPGGGFGPINGSGAAQVGGIPGEPPSGGGLAGFPGARLSAGISGVGPLSVSSALVSALETHASHYRWVAATSGSGTAASLELASGGKPVMAIGGFNNNGGLLTLAQFESYVKRGEIHYYIASGGGGIPTGPGGSSTTGEIASWVGSHFTARTIGGQIVYDLTR